MTNKVRSEKRVPLDRSLIDYLFKQKKEHPEWTIQKDSSKRVLKIWGNDTPYSLVISSADGVKVIAAIPEDNPLWIKVYDPNAYKTIVNMVGTFTPSSSGKMAITERW